MLLNHTVVPTTDGVTVHVGGKQLVMPGVSVEQMDKAFNAYTYGGQYVQDAYNFLSAAQREFLMSGLKPEEWAELFGEEES